MHSFDWQGHWQPAFSGQPPGRLWGRPLAATQPVSITVNSRPAHRNAGAGSGKFGT